MKLNELECNQDDRPLCGLALPRPYWRILFLGSARLFPCAACTGALALAGAASYPRGPSGRSYPPKINATEVLWNPFDDIVPRTLKVTGSLPTRRSIGRSVSFPVKRAENPINRTDNANHGTYSP